MTFICSSKGWIRCHHDLHIFKSPTKKKTKWKKERDTYVVHAQHLTKMVLLMCFGECIHTSLHKVGQSDLDHGPVQFVYFNYCINYGELKGSFPKKVIQHVDARDQRKRIITIHKINETPNCKLQIPFLFFWSPPPPFNLFEYTYLMPKGLTCQILYHSWKLVR